MGYDHRIIGDIGGVEGKIIRPINILGRYYDDRYEYTNCVLVSENKFETLH